MSGRFLRLKEAGDVKVVALLGRAGDGSAGNHIRAGDGSVVERDRGFEPGIVGSGEELDGDARIRCVIQRAKQAQLGAVDRREQADVELEVGLAGKISARL